MDAVEIKHALERRGFRQSDIARELGRHHATVNGVIFGRITSRAVAARIAEILGQPISVLWPDRYPRQQRVPRHKRA